MQPNLTTLTHEVRIYMVDGRPYIPLHTTKPQVEIGTRQAAAAFVMRQMNLGETEMTERLQRAVPTMCALASHAMSGLQDHCGLASKGAMSRVDLSAEFVNVPNAIRGDIYSDDIREQNIRLETEYILKRRQPAQWSPSGYGYVVRSYVNEVIFDLWNEVTCG